ncbi:5-deoxy-glucuronate isomerase [Tunturiibacter psychrotolerans]|uniref:5-deoxy-glucuronate isomerase n=1 Tax=Tunturiibacter psychrotolerans TaxID=3069686 RepID=UPI003D2486EA
MTRRLITGTANERGRRVFVQPDDGSMKLVSYGRIRLDKIEPKIRFSNDGQETGLICLSGTCIVDVGDESFSMKRDDALYVPKGTEMTVRAEQGVDLLECSAPVDGQYSLQFVSSESVGADEKLRFVAGTESARREINILLGSNIQAGRLIVGITRSLPGNWTSWPPHEHAAMLEEIYVYIDMPAPAFGLQLVYVDEISPAEIEVVREGDAVLLPAGYHPNVSIPGCTLNFVWIMAAHREVVDRKWGVVQVDPRYA